MSRCWDVANLCPLVVFVAGVRSDEVIENWFVAGVRVVEFGSKRLSSYRNILRIKAEPPQRRA